MVKVVYNDCFGKFNVSKEGMKWLKEHGYSHDKPINNYYNTPNLERSNKLLVQLVEELGILASGLSSNLKVKKLSSNSYKLLNCEGLELIIDKFK